MQLKPTRQRLMTCLMLGAAAVLAAGAAFVVSGPFAPDDFDITPDVYTSAAPKGQDSLEPALRSLDGVVYHG